VKSSTEIREFDFRQARPEEYEAVGAFLDRLRAERDPDDPPIPLEERIRRWQHMPAHIGFQSWVIWHRERPEVIAEAELIVHVADMNVAVLPEFRRQGLGRRLLAPVAAAAGREGRTLLVTTTHSTVPAGDAFMDRLGATMGPGGLGGPRAQGAPRSVRPPDRRQLEERPQVRRIRTGNAYVNEPMLKLNRELGFRPYRSMYIWQVDVSRVRAYLNQAGISLT